MVVRGVDLNDFAILPRRFITMDKDDDDGVDNISVDESCADGTVTTTKAEISWKAANKDSTTTFANNFILYPNVRNITYSQSTVF
mmetsp:Transcript_11734/g.15469  ORF Transcript_11734/g.15469 Transcript_11734/m.15469 type:complete len:85 (+) Transcript_11734:1278-1532(+)